MLKKLGIVLAAVTTVMALAVAFPVSAQQVQAEQTPTAKGASGTVQIAIERWTTDAERPALLAVVATTTDRPGGQDKSLAALQGVTRRTGYIRLANSLGWDWQQYRRGKAAGAKRGVGQGRQAADRALRPGSHAAEQDHPAEAEGLEERPLTQSLDCRRSTP